MRFVNAELAQAEGALLEPPRVSSEEPEARLCPELQVTRYRLQATSYKLQATSYKLQATSYKLQVTSYKLQATSYKLQVTSYKLHGQQLSCGRCSDSVGRLPHAPCTRVHAVPQRRPGHMPNAKGLNKTD